MSGGSFYHNCFKISDFADELKLKIKNNHTKNEYDDCYDLSEKTIDILKICSDIIETAGNLAHNIEWLYSGDYSDESFNNRAVPILNDFLTRIKNISNIKLQSEQTIN